MGTWKADERRGHSLDLWLLRSYSFGLASSGLEWTSMSFCLGWKMAGQFILYCLDKPGFSSLIDLTRDIIGTSS